MNIFFLSWHPKIAAEYHCDKHVVKMIIETAQMLYSAHSHPPENAYKQTHKNHPCTIWARYSLFNYMWLCSLGIWLCKEYTFRYGKIHKTQSHIEWLFNNPPVFQRTNGTYPAQAMPIEYKRESPIKAYETYYKESKVKRGFVKYTRREIPSFLE